MVVPVAGGLLKGQLVENFAAAMPQLPLAAEPISVLPPDKAVRRRRRKTDMSIIYSSVLAVVSIILVIVLFLLFRNQNASAEKKPEVTTKYHSPDHSSRS